MMQFYNQFEEFDPKDGKVSGHPFSVLPNIAFRARAVLRARSREEIHAAAKMIDAVLDQFFETEEDAFVKQQLSSNGWACKYVGSEIHDRHTALRELVRAGLPDTAVDGEYFDFPTRDNTTELDALKRCIENGYRFDDEEFKDALPQELFAVLSLWYLGDCLNLLKRNPWQHSEANESIQRPAGLWMVLGDSELKSLGFSIAAKEALMAMDAVCVSECLIRIRMRNSVIEILHDKLRQHDQGFSELIEKRVAEKRSEIGRAAAAKRHEEHRLLRECAIQHFEANEASYRSVEAAATAIAGKIVLASHRTVADWLYAHKKMRSASRP